MKAFILRHLCEKRRNDRISEVVVRDLQGREINCRCNIGKKWFVLFLAQCCIHESVEKRWGSTQRKAAKSFSELAGLSHVSLLILLLQLNKTSFWMDRE